MPMIQSNGAKLNAQIEGPWLVRPARPAFPGFYEAKKRGLLLQRK